jgi:DNA-binding Lrp family transcriptional regulator
MASVLEVLTQTGSLPLEELKLRTTASSEDVERRVEELKDQGLIEVIKKKFSGLSSTLGEQDIVELTDKGLRSAIRGR